MRESEKSELYKKLIDLKRLRFIAPEVSGNWSLDEKYFSEVLDRCLGDKYIKESTFVDILVTLIKLSGGVEYELTKDQPVKEDRQASEVLDSLLGPVKDLREALESLEEENQYEKEYDISKSFLFNINCKKDKLDTQMLRKVPTETNDLAGEGTTTTTVLEPASIEDQEVKEEEPLPDFKFLKDYLGSYSPSGFEEEGQGIWRDFMETISSSVSTDIHGNCIAVIPQKDTRVGYTDHNPIIMIEAHADEISYIITKINSNGIINVVRNGGSDESIAPSKKVLIHTKQGKIPAVFGWTAIHIRDKATLADSQNIYLDAGYDTGTAVKDAGIEIGDLVTYTEGMSILNDKIVGRSLDNKLGGYIISQVAKKIKEKGGLVNFDLMVANCVQEEIGMKGAKMVAETIKPDIVIVVDVTHDSTSPSIKDKNLGTVKLGEGPVLVRGAAIHDELLDLAKVQGVNYQMAAHSGRGTGTDADAFSYANGGTPTLLIKIPQKYMHTTVEMCSINDVKDTIYLMYLTLMNIDQECKDFLEG